MRTVHGGNNSHFYSSQLFHFVGSESPLPPRLNVAEDHARTCAADGPTKHDARVNIDTGGRGEVEIISSIYRHVGLDRGRLLPAPRALKSSILPSQLCPIGRRESEIPYLLSTQ